MKMRSYFQKVNQYLRSAEKNCKDLLMRVMLIVLIDNVSSNRCVETIDGTSIIDETIDVTIRYCILV